MPENEKPPTSLFDRVFSIHANKFKNEYKVVKIPWLTFRHHNQSFHIIIFRMRNSASHELPCNIGCVSKNVDLVILSSDHVVKGRIGGMLMRKNGNSDTSFLSVHLTNEDTHLRIGDSPEKLPTHVPDLVKQAVKELILRGGLAEWRSSDVLLQGGNILYQQLCQDHDISCRIERGQNEDGMPTSTYILTKPKSR